jgi:type IV pilus assembly protein PilY1
MVSFGTGRRLEQTQSSEAVFESATQSLFGVWDWNMTAWNGVAPASAKYAALATAPQPLAIANLTAQSITNEGRASSNTAMLRTVSATAVCWQGSTVCSSGNTQVWLAIAAVHESWRTGDLQPRDRIRNVHRQYDDPTEFGGGAQALSCNTEVPTGFTMGVSMSTGGAASQSLLQHCQQQHLSAA